MRIVHLSTSDMGGAGIAAKQLHLALLNNNIDSIFLSKLKLGADIKSHQVVETNSAFSNLRSYYLKNQKPGFEYFSFPYSGTDLHKLAAVINSDIVHLNWISDGFTDYKNVFSLNKKFVWTLHDMNPFTGGCHHSDGCTKFETNCNYCYQLEGTVNEYLSSKILTYKFEALSKIRNEQMIVVSPSQWLSNLSQKSKTFKRFKHIVIPNIVQLNNDKLTVEESCENLGISKSDFVFLFVANNVNNTRKGIHVLQDAFHNLPNKKNITLLTIGQKSGMNFAGIKTIELGFVTDSKTLCMAYSVANMFLLPSLAENFPNTIVESLSSGTPVMASDVGGISEQINSTNGILVEAGNVSAWTKALNDAIEGKVKFDGNSIAKDAKEKYNEKLIIKQYLNVYQNLINS